MRSLVFALAVIGSFVFSASAEAHGGFVRRNNVVVVQGGGHHVSRGNTVVVQSRGFFGVRRNTVIVNGR